MNKITTWIAAMIMVAASGFAVIAMQPTLVSACTGTDCITDGINQANPGGTTTNLPGFIKNVTNLLMFVLGAVAVIMLILGGIRYTTSNGNAEQIKAAKNTIMYAIIGLVVAILSWAIVTWIVGALTATP